MFATLDATVSIPLLSLGLMAGASVAAAIALVAFPLILSRLRKRLDAIEDAQAEAAALMASEAKRLAQSVATMKARQLGETIRRDRSQAAHKDDFAQDRRDPMKAANRQPLRKTVH